jgi:tetratricopeptide (TPR) repeat protein
MTKIFEIIKKTYPKCNVQEEKNYISFSFGSAFIYELRIQKGIVRLLSSNNPKKASLAECFKLIKELNIEQELINKNNIIYEEGVRNADKFTLRIEIPYQNEEIEQEGFITNIIDSCEKFHNILLPLLNAFHKEPLESLKELMSDVKGEKNKESDVDIEDKENITKADQYFKNGVELLKAGNFDESIIFFNKVIQIDPNHKSAYFNRGICRYNKGEFDLAIADFNKNISLNPNDGDTYYLKALAFIEIKNYSNAIKDLNQAIGLNSSKSSWFFKRGECLFRLENFEEALNDLDRAIQLENNNFKYNYYYYRALAKFKLGDFIGAIIDYKRIIENNPKDDRAYFNSGNAKRMNNDDLGAIEDYTLSIKYNPESGGAYCNRGISKLNINDKKGACLDFRKASDLGIELADKFINDYCKSTHLSNEDNSESSTMEITSIQIINQLASSADISKIIKIVDEIIFNGSDEILEELKSHYHSLIDEDTELLGFNGYIYCRLLNKKLVGCSINIIFDEVNVPLITKGVLNIPSKGEIEGYFLGHWNEILRLTYIITSNNLAQFFLDLEKMVTLYETFIPEADDFDYDFQTYEIEARPFFDLDDEIVDTSSIKGDIWDQWTEESMEHVEDKITILSEARIKFDFLKSR